MERIAPAHVDSPFEFAFAPSGTHARQLVRLEHATLRYGSAPPILDALELSILAGDRIGLLGPNGAGKSTLVKALAGELALARGTRHVAQNLVIGYFAQHQLEQLDLERRRCCTSRGSTRARASRSSETSSAASTSAATWSERRSRASPEARKRGWCSR
jgi:ATPase subunit of ABC transporter with duplicated ATPase domains